MSPHHHYSHIAEKFYYSYTVLIKTQHICSSFHSSFKLIVNMFRYMLQKNITLVVN